MMDRDREIYSEYISSLEDRDKKKFVSLLKFLKLQGTIFNKQKYEFIGGSDVVELKISNYRLLAHRIKNISKYKYIILCGFKKPKKGSQQREINTAKQYSAEIIAGNAIEQKRR